MNQQKNTTKVAIKNAPKKKKNVAKVADLKGRTRLVYSVPPCVEHYLEASINPFDAAPGACLPCDLLPLPSQKLKSFARGTFASGTTGFGFIHMCPAMASNQPIVNYTTAASVGTAATEMSAYTNMQTASTGASCPYVMADFSATGAGLRARAVSYGLRVRCTSSAMQRGGSYVCAEDEQHVTFPNGASSYTAVKSNALAKTHGIPLLVDPDQWDVACCSSGPAIASELEYGDYLGDPVTVGYSRSPLVIFVSTASPGMTFDFEAVIHYEVQGDKVSSLKTKSHASPNGFAASVEAMKGSLVTHGPVSPQSGRSIVESFKDFLLSEGPQLMEIGGGVARTLLGDPSGLLNVANGGFKLLTDTLSPNLDQRLTRTQKSIMAPEAPSIGWH